MIYAKFMLVLMILTVVFISGCTGIDPSIFAQNNPLVKEFLEEHPDAEIRVIHYSTKEAEAVLGDIMEDCQKRGMTAKEYYKVTLEDVSTDLKVIAWIDWENQLIECAVKTGGQPGPGDEECKPRYKVRCYEGNAYWYDSCGNMGEKKEACGNGCDAGRCIGHDLCKNMGGYCTYMDIVAEDVVSGDVAEAIAITTTETSISGMVHAVTATTDSSVSPISSSTGGGGSAAPVASSGGGGGSGSTCSRYYTCPNGEKVKYCEIIKLETPGICIESNVAGAGKMCSGSSVTVSCICKENPELLCTTENTVCRAGYEKSRYWCPDNGICCMPEEPECKPEAELRCYGGHVYWYDSCGKKVRKREYCRYGCSGGTCKPQPESEKCYDSDGGYNIFEKGVCEAGNQRLEDHCNSDGTLTEKFCHDENTIKWNSTTCPDGYECEGGACVEEGGCTEGETMNCGSNIGECSQGNVTCTNGQWGDCVGEVGPVDEICNDSKDNDCDGSTDEGCSVCDDHYEAKCHDGDLYWYDSCGTKEDKKEDCEHGCEDGVCIAEPQTECRDEDYECTIEDIPCCDGLVEIALAEYDETEGMCIAANCGQVCRPCGNGICDDNENQCSCPEDCSEWQNKSYLETEGYVTALETSNDLLLMGVNIEHFNSSSGSLISVDVSDPGNPEILDEISYDDYPGSIKIDGDMAYVLVDDLGFRVIDISNPNDIEQVGTYQTSVDAYTNMDISGTNAFITDNCNGLRILDISNASNPALIKTVSFPSPSCAVGVAICNNYAYVENGWGDARYVSVVDVSDPANANIINSHSVSITTRRENMECKNAVVYTGYDSMLEIVDFSSPMSPVQLANVSSDTVDGVIMSSDPNVLVFGTWEEGIKILDISDNSIPVIIDSYSTVGSVSTIAEDEYEIGLFYIGFKEGGVQIVEYLSM